MIDMFSYHVVVLLVVVLSTHATLWGGSLSSERGAFETKPNDHHTHSAVVGSHQIN